ncbi:stress activated map kinase interacting [Fusarium albosuccineum]|uniref:Stress activated map kinase interacting n=1 Tax=Fusarium albosuccineum TaxID=1237068 RepID=A0A8H4LDW2_9HYPO|nr:stress activated map kinase interacting [Fusarium albosuccineum]
MGLVDYSDSDGSGSEAEAPVKTAPKPAATSKKPFQKVVDRSNPGKIVVNLPQLSDQKQNDDGPPTKRVKTGGSGLFSGFNSFLPAPKNANKPKPAASTVTSSELRKPGINFKTSAAPGFSRRTEDDGDTPSGNTQGGMGLPPPKAAAQPSIPEGQKPADEVKLVGKPLMFKPLSVARNPQKKKKLNAGVTKPAAASPQSQGQVASGGTEATAALEASPAPAPKKVSLFSMHTEEPSEPSDPGKRTGAYEPMFATQESSLASDDSAYGDYAQYASHSQTGPSATTLPGSESLGNVADDLNLTAAQRRELFGRGGLGNQAAKKVINFNMDREYQHNEEIRAAGEQQIHNPVRAIQGGGKHSLRQLVSNVQNQREALEDSFAKGKSNRKEASSRYGW